jgi:hypothetical protein
MPSNVSVVNLRTRFKELCSSYDELKKTRLLLNRYKIAFPVKHYSYLQISINPTNTFSAFNVASTRKIDIRRLKSPRTKNRYRTVESPVFVKPPHSVRQVRDEDQQSLIVNLRDTPSLQDQQPLIVVAKEPASPHVQSGHPPLPRTRTPRHRARYSFKRIDRTKVKKRPRPPKMKQYVHKPYKEPEQKTEQSHANPKPKKPLRTLSSILESSRTEKLGVLQCLAYQHPTSSLEVGTLAANVKRTLEDQENLQKEVVSIIEDAVGEAARIKRHAQMLIGAYIEHLGENEIKDEDRNLLDYLCPRVDMGNVKNSKDNVTEIDDDGEDIVGVVDEEEDDEIDDEEEATDNPDGANMGGSSRTKKNTKKADGFLLSFLCYLYNGSPRSGVSVSKFTDRLIQLGLHDAGPSQVTAFPAAELLESAASQLRVELKKMYKNGTCDLHKKVWFKVLYCIFVGS